MAEYIERGSLLAEYDRQHDGEPGRARKLIEEAPAADVVPVRHGRWFMRGGKWRCSECDQKALLRLSDATGGCREYEYYRANYCPNCGVKMDKEADK